MKLTTKTGLSFISLSAIIFLFGSVFMYYSVRVILADDLSARLFQMQSDFVENASSVNNITSLSNKNIDLVGLWHPRPERLKEACNKHNLRAYENWEDLVNDSKVDGIIIATPPEPRYELALEAIKGGKHLLLEKPTCLNSEEVKELQRNALKRNLKSCPFLYFLRVFLAHLNYTSFISHF